MKFDRTKLGAGATLAALGGLAAVAIGQSNEGGGGASKPAAVQVRTQVIRQTVRVVRHEKPRRRRHASVPAVARRRASAAPPPSASPAAAAPFRPGASAVTRSSGVSHAAPAPHPVTTRSSGHSGSGTTVHHPVTTRSSGGSGGGGGEHESEHGDD